jgi:hypothetical protein
MIGMESHLLVAILRRSALSQPVTCGEGFVLANSMIEGTEAKNQVDGLEKEQLEKSSRQ